MNSISPPATSTGGTLWVWERMHSRRRERQLSEAHERLMERDRQLNVLIRLVRQNTRALVGFDRLQKQTCKLLEEIRHEIHDRHKAR